MIDVQARSKVRLQKTCNLGRLPENTPTVAHNPSLDTHEMQVVKAKALSVPGAFRTPRLGDNRPPNDSRLQIDKGNHKLTS